MAKAKTKESDQEPNEETGITTSLEKAEVAAKPKGTVKTVHMHAGCDLLGSKTSITSGKAELFELPGGIKCVSKGTKRIVVIPFANIRAYELL